MLNLQILGQRSGSSIGGGAIRSALYSMLPYLLRPLSNRTFRSFNIAASIAVGGAPGVVTGTVPAVATAGGFMVRRHMRGRMVAVIAPANDLGFGRRYLARQLRTGGPFNSGTWRLERALPNQLWGHSHPETDMRLEGKEFAALALIAVMMLSPLAAAVMTADSPKLQHKARTDLITPDPAKPPTGAPPPPAAPKP